MVELVTEKGIVSPDFYREWKTKSSRLVSRDLREVFKKIKNVPMVRRSLDRRCFLKDFVKY